MESKEHLILINGQDKTDSVASFRFQDGMCEVVFAGSPKVYRYHSDKVQVLAVQRRIDPAELVVVVRGEAFSQIEEILDFGPCYRLLRPEKKPLQSRDGTLLRHSPSCDGDGVLQEDFFTAKFYHGKFPLYLAASFKKKESHVLEIIIIE